jgi:hypothetical protein
MKWLFLILFSAATWTGMAQQTDSLKRADPKERAYKSPSDDANKESFGDYVQKVGLGIWGKVKERFNLEGVVENLEEKKNKFLGDKNKNGSDEKAKAPKEKVTKGITPKSDT